ITSFRRCMWRFPVSCSPAGSAIRLARYPWSDTAPEPTSCTCLSVKRSRSVQRIDQELFDAGDQLGRAPPKDAPRLLREIPYWVAVISEDVMVEHVPPGRQLVRRQVPHRDDRVIKRVQRSQQRRLGIAPPEIDQ